MVKMTERNSESFKKFVDDDNEYDDDDNNE